MDGTLIPIAVGVLALLLVAAIVAWWQSRRRMARIRRQLERSERACAELQQSAQEMRARLSAVDQLRQMQSPPKREPAVKPATAPAPAPAQSTAAARGSGPSAARESHDSARPPGKAAPPRAAIPVAAPAAAPERRRTDWKDTELMDGHSVPPAFAETLPAELGHQGSAHQFAATMPAEFDAQSRPMQFAQTLPLELAFEFDLPASGDPPPPSRTPTAPRSR